MRRWQRKRREPIVSDDEEDTPMLDSSTAVETLAALCAKEETDLETIQFIVDKGGRDANEKGARGRTPLMCAAERGNVPLVRFLLCRSALVNQRDREGNTALHLCGEHANAVRLLLRAGACTAFANEAGDTVKLYQLNMDHAMAPPRTIFDMVLSGDLHAVRARFDTCHELPCACDNAGRTLLKMLHDDVPPKTPWVQEMARLLLEYGGREEVLKYHQV